MSPMRESFESTLPDWVGDALREPVESTANARARIMSSVRELPAPRALSAPMRPSRWTRRGWLSPIAGAVTSLAMGMVVLFRVSNASVANTDIETMTRILGDSVVPANFVQHAGVNDASAREGHWLDTLRIVEFVIRGSSIRAASVLGDFNGWQRGRTTLVAVGGNEWRARVLVPRDALNMAYLVNDARLVGGARF